MDRPAAIPRGDGQHILLVDDEKAIAEVTGDMLQRLGYRVTIRVSSIETLEAFRNLSSQIDDHVPTDWVAALYKNQDDPAQCFGHRLHRLQ
ncbi:MAG: hypothetical protein CSA33_03735 [Desulfobulbus propionicus]|nr:MAG: hypothetical protein CSA33_03735 [Desulfobulbus propionicus]